MNTIEWLKDQCIRYQNPNGVCSTLACMKRGGYKGGTPSDYIATCPAHATIQALERIKEAHTVIADELAELGFPYPTDPTDSEE